jgi:hypothetical protein
MGMNADRGKIIPQPSPAHAILEADRGMSETFDKLKALLEKQGTLSDDDFTKMIADHGALSDAERTTLEAERYEKSRAKDQKITLEQYLEASKVLDSAAEGSDEYKKALTLVEAYESGN